jgi:glucokinase
VNPQIILGADVGGSFVKYVLGDVERPDRFSGDVPTDPADPAATFARLLQRVGELTGGAEQLAAAGLACAGIVDPGTGVLGRAPNLHGWEGADLFAALRAAAGDVPCAVANDVNAALVGEARFGAGRGAEDLVMLALGTGVGGGVLVGGRLLVGHRNGAAELGHMILDPAGPRCACGNFGCLEAYAGSVGLLAEAGRRAAAGRPGDAGLVALAADRGAALSTRDLADAAASGDAGAASLFCDAGEKLGQAVGNLLNVLDPDRVIIGGGVAQAGELLMAPCRDTARRLVLCAAARATPIVPAELGPLAAALGAAALARDLLAAPITPRREPT